jgi:hypothetical protein
MEVRDVEGVIDQPDARPVLRHACATLAYRAGKVLRGAPPAFSGFKVADKSRTPGQILAHLGDLLDWGLSLAKGRQAWHDSTPSAWDDDVQRFFRSLGALDDFLAGSEPLACPWTRFFSGPLADAFTHVGQLAMLRRIADAPIKGENYYVADIRIGRVGPDQMAPKREFD